MARTRHLFHNTVESILRFVRLCAVKYAFLRKGYQYLTVLLFVGLFVFTAGMSVVLSQMTGGQNSQNIELARQYVKNGEDDYKNGLYQEAINSLEEAAKIFQQQKDWKSVAITLSNLGLSQLELGQPSQALKSWEEAQRNYARLEDGDKDKTDGIMKSKIYQAQALQASGLYYRSCETLISAVVGYQLTCDDLDKEFKKRTYWDLINQEITNKEDSIKVMVWRNFGDILRVIGDLDKSEEALRHGLEVAKKLSSPKYEAVMHLSLGNTFRAKGNLERDRRSSPVYDYMPWEYHEPKEIEEAKEFYNCAEIQYQFLIGSSYSEKNQEAKKFNNCPEIEYQSLIDYSYSSVFKLQAQLNLLSLLIERGKMTCAEKLSSQIYSKETRNFVSEPPQGLTGVYAKVNLAKSLAYLNLSLEKKAKQDDKQAFYWEGIITNLLIESQQEAKKLNNKRAESYALGNLGGLYEYLGKLDKAQRATQDALYLSQPSEAPDIAYQWQWQIGRLLRSQGKIEKAIISYKDAVKTLESVRGDLLSINSDVQFSFRDNVEPLYRELVDTLISRFQNERDSFTSTIEINDTNDAFEVPEYIDSLQLAELENFVRCNLSSKIVILRSYQNKKLTKNIYPTIIPIILKNKLIVILSTMDRFSGKQKIYLHQETISSDELEKSIETLRGYLKIASRREAVKKITGQLYNWFIKPFEGYIDIETNFDDSKIKTLVFLLDGSFKNIPMSVLYDNDRKRYLLERYAIAVAPSLKLVELEHLPNNLNVLTGGLSREVKHPFKAEKLTPLKGVPQELNDIQSLLPSEKLLDDTFTEENLKTQIKTGKFSIVHLATHGEFSSDPKKTFILLGGQTSHEKLLNNSLQTNSVKSEALYSKGLDNLLRTNTNQKAVVKLLVLSACQTALGDKRAALGLSGLAVRAGALSTIASLWQVDDEATPKVMAKFYQVIKENREATRATALREAQLSLWNNKKEIWKDPYYWSAYILVGNWL